MELLCHFAMTSFAQPNVGVHSLRIGGFAFVDILATLAISIIIARAWQSYRAPSTPFAALLSVTVAALVAMAIAVHHYLLIPTALNVKLGLVSAPLVHPSESI